MLARRLGIFACLSVALATSPLYASVVSGYDLPTLVTRSEQAVAVQVEETSARYDEHGQIVTDVIARVSEVGKGRARPGEVVQFVIVGGSVGSVTMRVEGSVRFSRGDDVMLFLERHRSGHLIPVGLSQGVMRIVMREGQRHVMPGGAGLVLMSRDPSGRMVPTGPALDAPEPVASFVDRVRALAGSGAP